MKDAERILIVVLRLSAVALLTALPAAFLPFGWMAAIHRWIGLGELPDVPIIGYLTRSTSGMYALHGALVLYMSFDVRRYMPLIRFTAMVGIAFGAGVLLVDWRAAMPLHWTIAEGPFVIALNAVILRLVALAFDRDEAA